MISFKRLQIIKKLEVVLFLIFGGSQQLIQQGGQKKVTVSLIRLMLNATALWLLAPSLYQMKHLDPKITLTEREQCLVLEVLLGY